MKGHLLEVNRHSAGLKGLSGCRNSHGRAGIHSQSREGMAESESPECNRGVRDATPQTASGTSDHIGCSGLSFVLAFWKWVKKVLFIMCMWYMFTCVCLCLCAGKYACVYVYMENPCGESSLTPCCLIHPGSMTHPIWELVASQAS